MSEGTAMRDLVRPGAAERVTRATLLRYKTTVCRQCGNEFRQLETRSRTVCRDCRPYKRGVRA